MDNLTERTLMILLAVWYRPEEVLLTLIKSGCYVIYSKIVPVQPSSPPQLL